MAAQPPPGALPPGTKLQVGSHEAVIKRYISEGGFAHVYVVEISPPEDGSNIACLKRVVVPDKLHLNLLRAEVDAMKRLKGHPNIVKYLDSHAARLGENGSAAAANANAPAVIGYNRSDNGSVGYEVLLLMEYCSKKGLIDFMNTRLREQLTETEILKIMSDVTNGLACMHYMQPPLIHRDLKIENVLISSNNTYKLCDFGSVSPVLRPPKNSQELHILSEDIQRNTTAQYRAPEMIDIYRGFPIGEKCDIWALGVFLYKLCYYTTPFEREGQLAILHAKFTFPERPVYSDRLKRIIRVTLSEDPRNRPNVYQVLKEICLMRGVEVPIKDIYSQEGRSSQHNGGDVQSPATTQAYRASSEEASGVVYKSNSTAEQKQHATRQIPDITPMYRGRPPKAAVSTPSLTEKVQVPKSRPAKPSSSSSNADPFSTLGSQRDLNRDMSMRSSAPTTARHSPGISSTATTSATEGIVDDYDAATRFPSVEDLSKALEKQSFSFERPAPAPVQVSRALPPKPPAKSSYMDSAVQTDDGFDFDFDSSSKKNKSTGAPPALTKPKPIPQVNVITDSSPSPSSSTEYLTMAPSNRRRPTPRQRPVSMYARSNPSHESLSGLQHQQQQSYQSSTTEFLETQIDSDSSSDHEGLSAEDREQLKTILTGVSERSSTMILESDNHIDSNVDFLRSLDHEGNHLSRASSVTGRRSGQYSRTTSYGEASVGGAGVVEEDVPLSMPQPRRVNRSSSSHSKRSSISSIKNLIGDTMKIFDGSGSVNGSGAGSGSGSGGGGAQQYTQSYGSGYGTWNNSNTNIDTGSNAGSSYSGSQSSGQSGPGTNTPAAGLAGGSSLMTRSMSTRSSGSLRGHSRTTSGIQSRIQNFLSRRNSPPPRKTAEGYGKYTDAYHTERRDGSSGSSGSGSGSSSDSVNGYELHTSRTVSESNPSRGASIGSGSGSGSKTAMGPPLRSAKAPAHIPQPLERLDSNTSASSASTVGDGKSAPRPSVPRKPVHLQSPKRPVAPSEIGTAEDWEWQFNQKYPSLKK